MLEAADYLASQSGLELGERFLGAASAEFDLLAGMPQMGAVCGFRSSKAKRIRRWPVTGFENWLIFYEPVKSGIDVVRLLHGAQDIESILD